MKRLFELYNVFVDRYKKAQSNPAARSVWIYIIMSGCPEYLSICQNYS
jgi:hypothetical protein